MAVTKERRTAPRKANSTPKPDSLKAAQPMTGEARAEASAEEIRLLIAEAAYYRAKQRGFAPGHELDDWVQAESEVMRRVERST